MTLNGDLGMLLFGAIKLNHRVKDRRGRQSEERWEDEQQQKTGEVLQEGGVLRHGGDLSTNCQDGLPGCSCRRDSNFSIAETHWHLFYYYYFHCSFKRKRGSNCKIRFFSSRLSVPAGLFKWWKRLEGRKVLLAWRLQTAGSKPREEVNRGWKKEKKGGGGGRETWRWPSTSG